MKELKHTVMSSGKGQGINITTGNKSQEKMYVKTSSVVCFLPACVQNNATLITLFFFSDLPDAICQEYFFLRQMLKRVTKLT